MKQTRVESAECALCTYKININIGEPMDYGITNNLIFNFIK